MNGFDAIITMLKREGVEWLAAFPNNPLIEAAAKQSLRPIVFRQERGGVMAADGFSRMKHGRPFGVFCSQGGPGVENAFGGIAQAWTEGVPLLYLPGGANSDRADVTPNFRATANYQHVTKWAEAVNRIDRVVPLMRRAVHALKNGRPGPVVLELPIDIMGGEVTNLDDYRSPQPMVTQPTRGAIKDAVTQLLKAKRPVIWAGQGVLYAEASDLLTELAELTQIPVITTMPGKSAIDEHHPLSLGAANRTAPKAVWTWLKESDLLFAIGSSLTITAYGITVPAGKFMIHSTNNPGDINKDYPIDIPLLGDARLVLEAMIDEVKGQLGDTGRSGETGIQDDIASVKFAWQQEWAPLLTADTTPINPYRLVAEINRAVPKDRTIFTHDAGHPRDQVMPFYTVARPNGYVGWGKTTHLGYGIPLMIGAKLANPDKFCMNFMGDAAFGMSGLDIETAVRAGAPITTVLLNNGTMGGYSQSMPNAMANFDAGHMSGDYAKIAEGLGAVGIKVNQASEIAPAIERAQQLNSEGRCVLLDVKTCDELKMSVYPLK
jgi:thiamine pyrophosphate-dependent acetolactate synthase large subunit-like protein